MAAVTNVCPSKRRSRSEENVLEVISSNCRPKDFSKEHIMKLLSQLPPSKELLTHYQAKLAQYETDSAQLSARVKVCAELLDTSKRLEVELNKRDEEIECLRGQLEQAAINIHQERAKHIKLESDNDRLRIKDIENERKIKILLKLSGKREEEVVDLLEKDLGRTSDRSGAASTRNSRIDKMASKAKERREAQLRSSLSLETELQQLSQQLVEQEKLHRDQLEEERKIHRKNKEENSADKRVLRGKLAEFQKRVTSFENQMTLLSDQLSSQQSNHRKNENVWTNEKAVLMRKIQFFEKYGTSEGLHSDHRAKARISGSEKTLFNKIKSLQQILESKDRELEECQAHVVRYKEEMKVAVSKSEASDNLLAKRSNTMTEKLNNLSERYKKLEERKHFEAQGYQADIKLLRDKMCALEDKLLAMSMAFKKEEEQTEILEKLSRELQKIEKKKPRAWKD